jgi:hypothetical protein
MSLAICLGISVSLCIASTFYLPWIICNLHYALTDQSCLSLHISNIYVSFTMRTWLYVDTGTMIIYFILVVMSGLSVMISQSCKKCTFQCVITLSPLFSLFRTIWFIIGAIMFYG